MPLYLEQRMQSELRITPQMVIANELLAMSVTDLEQAVTGELEENPALELIERERCPYCGSPLQHNRCPSCRDRQNHRDDMQSEGWHYQDYRSYTPDHEDETDPFSHIAYGPSLSEYLNWQVAQMVAAADQPIARYLIDSLDDHGFLTVTADEVARSQGIAPERVNQVIAEIQKLEPWGIGARTPQECLLIQLQRMIEEGTPVDPLAERLIGCWDLFLRRQYHVLARELDVSEADVLRCYQYIQENLHPFPAHAHWSIGEAQPASEAVYVRPDIAIRRRPAPDEGFEVEVLSAHSFALRIDSTYERLASDLEGKPGRASEEAQQQLREYIGRGKLFIRCVNQRWQTLQMIGNWIANYQADFLNHGVKAIKPITRAELADQIGVHESTVSRAVANKYVLLPNGRIIPMSDFFDDSLAAKKVLQEIVEKEARPMSDQELAKKMAARGYPIARRTVAKYRQEMAILPARLRCAKRVQEGA